MLGSDAATAQPTAAAITAVAAAAAADDDGVTRTEHEQTDCTTDMTRFRDEQSGQKRKKTATKVTRENVRTAVSDDGIDHDLLRSKFDRVLPPSGGGMKPAPPGGGRRMPAPPGGVGKPTPLLESNLRSKEWFEDMTKRRDERWAKFMQQNNKNSGAENSDKMFSKFWDDQANSFKKTMEQTKWGMNDAPGAGKSRRSTTSTSSSADTVEEKIPTTPPSPPLPTEGAGDAADVGAGGTVSDNGGKLNGARMTSIVCEGGSSSRRSVQSEDRFTLLSENGVSSRLSSGFGSLHPRMSRADSETSDTPFSGSLS
ncbi:PREDICTED: uncharacterized protein LOC106806796 [Priapulus caudatus]|uniref:Uncharacterized protein LOC106806796 n=1 Tax=Priapulus caudatus TaxID=37621 RepID=A0ABM1DWP2_PRICU|nr:PREDICTED: uncharacterized protein LOC106806796 [Priapulus caudatus]